MSEATTYGPDVSTPQTALQGRSGQSSDSRSRAAGGRKRASTFGFAGFEISAATTPWEYHEKYALVPTTFGSWTLSASVSPLTADMPPFRWPAVSSRLERWSSDRRRGAAGLEAS